MKYLYFQWARTSRAFGRAVVLFVVVMSLVLASLPTFVNASASATSTVSPVAGCPWISESLNHSATAQHMADQVVRFMTPSELANFVVLHAGAGVENFNVGVPRLCIPAITLVDGPSGVGNGARGVTQFPSELAVAASFNPLVARQVGFAMAQEALSKGYDVLQAPDLNLIRTPLSGRAFETYGEDPFLASLMGVAAIEGIQSTGVMAQAKHLGAYTQENGRARLNQRVSRRVLTEIYNAPFKAAVQVAHVASIMCAMGMINGVNTCSNKWLYQTLRSWGFRGFVRSDYSAVTTPTPAFKVGMSLVKPSTTTTVLAALARGHLRLRSLRSAVASVLTEMFAFGLVTHPRSIGLATPATTADHAMVALRAERQGIVLLKNTNQVLPLPRTSSVAVIGVDAREGIISRGGGSSAVHASFLQTPLAALGKLLPRAQVTYSPGGLSGLEFNPLKSVDVVAGTPPPGEIPASLHTVPGSGDVALAYAKAVTPAALTATTPGHGAGWSNWDVTFRAEKSGTYVLGLTDYGDTWLSLNGHTILADRGLHGAYFQSTSVTLVAGQSYTVMAQWFALGASNTPGFGIDYVQSLINAAVAAAKKAHTAVIYAGNLLTEGADLPSLWLQGDLNALISAVAKVNPRTVVVLTTGGPVLMPWRSKVAGIVEAWYGGQMVGPAIAQVLTGAVDPSGRLPVSMPALAWQTPAASPSQFPGQGGTVKFGGLSDIGYRWYQANSVTPAYPFGYGLSYTNFSWSNISISRSGSGVSVALRITNTGKVAGVDVAQVYVAYPGGLGEPPEQLKGIGRVDLAPGAYKDIVIYVPRSAFTYDNGHALVVSSNPYQISVATNSANLVASQTLSLN
ncbi:MAG: glycoside hydrolase family 3 protein [Acidimicrobiaceae bacterium]|nr:glycoside hydrolase family 3 protein [Acidimicrobiaceae bacterium]